MLSRARQLFSGASALMLVALILANPQAASGQVLHVIIATDDLDPRIGSAVRQDAINVHTEFFTGVPAANLNITRIRAGSLNQDSILAAIRARTGGGSTATTH